MRKNFNDLRKIHRNHKINLLITKSLLNFKPLLTPLYSNGKTSTNSLGYEN